jgi:DNA polymerase-3 subunit beta
LALSEISEIEGIKAEKQIIIPRKGILEIARLLSNEDTPAKVSISQNHIRISTNDLVFTSKLIDGKFPDYNRVIPVDGNKTMTVNRDLLKQALHRISILSNEKYRGIRLSTDGNNLTIQANNPDQEEAQEEITVQYDESNIEIGFNVTYLLDVLSVLDSEDVLIKLKDSNSSCVITSTETDKYRYVVMPMRL